MVNKIMGNKGNCKHCTHSMTFLVYGILELMGKVKRYAHQEINGNQYLTKQVINILLA